MSNDAKLGMLAGVLGVIVAGVLSSRAPDAPPNGAAKGPARAALPEAPAPRTASAASAAKELPGTPVVHVRKETEAQPASRPTSADDEP